MYRALVDPADALRLFEASRDAIVYEAGNSKANTYAWISALGALGQVESGVTANYPLYAVFRKGKTRTYCVYNMAADQRTITFSNGFTLKATAKGFVQATAAD